MCAFWSSVPAGTTSETGAKSKLTPAAASWLPQRAAFCCSVAGSITPWSTADGMRSKPGPRSAWIRPPSWFAAMKNRTPPVETTLACAWTSSEVDRIAATPTVVVAVNDTLPKWYCGMAARSVEPIWSFARPTMNSWPMRCPSVIEANVWLAHAWERGGEAVGSTVGDDDGFVDGIAEAVAPADGDAMTAGGVGVAEVAGPAHPPKATAMIAAASQRVRGCRVGGCRVGGVIRP